MDHLATTHPKLTLHSVLCQSAGDQNQTDPLTQIGTTGVFVKALQESLLRGQADLAVHSMKDLPATPHPELSLVAIIERADPRDVLITPQAQTLRSLKKGARIGTGSPRREAFIRRLRPDVHVHLLRGNINTRLSTYREKGFDAIMLAAAGLNRLNLAHREQNALSINDFVPAIGQGAIGVECRQADANWLAPLLATLHHPQTAAALTAERALNQRLQGGCHTPLGAHATLEGNELILQAALARLDGTGYLTHRATSAIAEARDLGHRVADALLAQGAKALLVS
jgi:hydroxymethylbilane synthase